MNNIEVDKMEPGTYYASSVYLDSGFMVLSGDLPVTESLIAQLKRWQYQTLFTEGSPIPSEVSATNALSGANLDQDEKEKEGIYQAQKAYDRYLDFAEEFYEKFKRTNHINLNILTDFIKDMIAMVKEHEEYILRFAELKNVKNRPYFITHAVRTTIIALTIASKLKNPRIAPHKVIEVGISCMLHEVGMLQIPPEIYNKEGTLTPEEKKTISLHPLLGYRMLKEMKELQPPLSQDILQGVLEHHERENGSGYPQKLHSPQISLYGKIIAIACSYDAQISSRPFRSEKDAHTSIATLLKEMENLYDRDILLPLLEALSLYPIGCYVIMKNQAIGVVIKTNRDKPRYPIVKLLVDENRHPYKEPPMVQTSEKEEGKIVRVLTSTEVNSLKENGVLK
ncbi:MAG: HD domain-containing protein [Spirochaetales bacterium]|nr:HD domain-containing protein [Spirochaetales bacterium]